MGYSKFREDDLQCELCETTESENYYEAWCKPEITDFNRGTASAGLMCKLVVCQRCADYSQRLCKNSKGS